MDGYDAFLLCSTVFGVGLFSTKIWSTTLITLESLGALEDGGPLWRTALIGVGIGIVAALINPHVTGLIQGLAYVVASTSGVVHGRLFVLAAQQALRNPHGWFVERHVVAGLSALVDKRYQELSGDPAALSAYLDKTYGKGVVKPEDLKRGLANASARQVATLQKGGAPLENAILEATANALRAQKSLEKRAH